ncbi:MAG: imidazole glycerol phosphate synthase subunit HisH [Bacteroidetes bacterium]|nr:imidazole glycerol phosphate synthase subunit HisH [Bacteroidota bacterium]
MIVIVNYGLGNLASIKNMFKKIGAESIISSDLEVIGNAEKLLLPGVGAFDNGMTHINDLGFRQILNKKVMEDKVPILGICLGMQLLTRSSEEGQLEGLGWIDAKCDKFNFESIETDTKLRVPHMGWNEVNIQNNQTLFKGFEQGDAAFYFVHSYHVVCENEADIMGMTPYGYEFVSVIQKDNIFGAQFHPEKSHKYGMRLLKNFVDIDPKSFNKL